MPQNINPMAQPVPQTRDYPADVRIVEADGREFILIGTAHISQESTDLVKQVIEQERPDRVCVELDEQRYKTLADQRKWESLDLKEVIRQQQLTTLLVNLLLSAYQKKLGSKLGVLPGAELLEATQVAKELDIPISLCDRDVRITLRRAWHAMSFFEKFKLLASGMVGVFETQEISEEMLAELRKKDVLNELMQELGRVMPVLKSVLLDERDAYIAQKTKEAAGDRIVAVVGAGHVEGIYQALTQNNRYDLAEIEKIPPASPVGKWFGWGIPAVIVSALVYIGLSQGSAAAGENLLYWILVNSIPTGLAAILALAHPVTVVAAALAAPLTSLTPVIGAGYVGAFVQAYYQPPVVRELQTVTEDVGRLQNWWRNKLLRVFLVFIFTTLGSAAGTYLGAYQIISNIF